METLGVGGIGDRARSIGRPRRLFWPSLALDRTNIPWEAAEFLRRERPAGLLFNTYRWGGLFAWRLGPEQKVFLYGQQDVFPVDFVDDALRWPDPGTWRRLDDRYWFGTVIVDADPPWSHRGLDASPAFALAYADSLSCVYVRHPLPADRAGYGSTIKRPMTSVGPPATTM